MHNLPDDTAKRRHAFTTLAAVSAVFALTVLCYWPSLSGPFLFDDLPNLELLGERGGITSIDTFMEFVSSAQSGPLGRPLSLASFVVDGRTWPTDARPFRVTNLIIHLTNGLLVFLLARSLLETVHDRRTALKLGLVCMAVWILHPLLVSTTAYIIQRMTQLASLFTLVGLLCYVHGRKTLPEAPRRGWAWILAGMGLGGTLAVLSKETGILLPLYALVIEFTVFGATAAGRRHRHGLILLLCAPLLAALAYLLSNWDSLQAGFDIRPFSMKERMLTEPVVLVEYLRQVFVPQLSGLGVIHDDFPISRGLMSPPRTLASLLVLAALVAAAIRWRRNLPLVSLGVLWFIAGHSLEAGPVALELYFEHRNYLPIVGVLIAVCSLLPVLPARIQRPAVVLLVLFFCLEAFVTWQSAKLWGDEDLMMRVALVDHPKSLRARQHVANAHVRGGRYEQALEAQRSIASDFPQHASTRLSILNLRCLIGTLTTEQVVATQAFLERSPHDLQIVGFLQPLLSNAVDQACPAFGLVEYRAVLDVLLRNPASGRNPETRGAAYYFKGMAYHREGRVDEAVEALNRSFDAAPEVDIRLQQVVWLLAEGRVDDAERYLGLADQYREERPWRRVLRDADFDLLQQQIDLLRRRQHDREDSGA